MYLQSGTCWAWNVIAYMILCNLVTGGGAVVNVAILYPP